MIISRQVKILQPVPERMIMYRQVKILQPVPERMIAPILGAAIASGLQLHTQVVQTMQLEVYTLFYKYDVNDGSDFEIFPPRNIVFSLFINFLHNSVNPGNFYVFNISCLYLIN